MFQIKLVGVLAHCFRLKLGTAKPALVFGVVSLSTEGAMKIGGGFIVGQDGVEVTGSWG